MHRRTESAYDTESCDPVASCVPVIHGLPGIGVALRLHRNALNFFSKTLKRYGDRVELRVLGRRVLLLANPADINEVLIRRADDFGRSTEVTRLRQVFGDGIYLSEGERWRKQRRVLGPVFHGDFMMSATSTIIERMTERASKWRDGQTVDAFNEMMALMAGVMCDVVFGRQQSSPANTIANSASAVFENLHAEILYLPLWQRLPIPWSSRWKRAVAALHETINHMIADRRSAATQSDDLLGVLVSAKDERGHAISDQDVHDEVMTMFLAGQETSSVALSWAIALLAQHHDLQDQAAEEIARVAKGREVNADDYRRFEFLTAIVLETLRLYPPLWSIGRKTLRDTTVRDLEVCSGTEVWIPIYQVQRDPRWFSKPDQFNPHRFPRCSRIPKAGYLPFGGGLRSCVAQHFAMAELVLALAVMLSRFRFRLAPGAKLEMNAWLTLRPKNPVYVTLSAC